MASKLPNSIVKTATRCYGAKAAAAPQAAAASDRVRVSKLPSGTVVASVDEDSPLARVSVYLKAGSRYNGTPGDSHFLSLIPFGGYSTPTRSGLDMIHTLDQLGAKFATRSDREVASYDLSLIRDNVGEMFDVLSCITSNNDYAFYEFPNSNDFPAKKQILNFVGSLAARTPADVALDLAAKAAYRAQPLGNSVYMPERLAGVWKFKVDSINNFIQATHGTGGLVIVGSGVEHDVLTAGASAIGVQGGSVQAIGAGTKFLGGDVRLDQGGSQSTVCVAAEGAKLGAERLTALVAAELLGGPANLKYGVSSSSAMAGILKDSRATLQSFATSYTDSGMLGFTLSASAAEAPELVAKVTGAIRKLSPSEKEVEGAKNRVKRALIEQDGSDVVEEIGRQLLLTGSYTGLAETVKAVDAVSKSSVQQFVSKAFSGKLAVAAVGEVHNIPYSDAL